MKILYVGTKYDYGKPEQGYSFEHYNFFHALHNLGHEIIYFDFMALMQKRSKEWMNGRLKEVAQSEQPDLMFTVLAENELDKDVVANISKNTNSVNWFCDDHWRFDNFSKFWAPCFNWVVTTANSALPKYEKIKYHNVIKSQWACNHFLYRQLDLPLIYDVTFVGQPHGNRRQVIEKLRENGFKVSVWGTGWETGRLSQEEMINVFNQSRINLNLSNSIFKIESPKEKIRNRIRQGLSKAANWVPGGRTAKELWKESRKTIIADQSTDTSYLEQIKGRNFEVPGCSGFMLTGRPENLEEYYRINEEVVCHENSDDLVSKVKYYLENESERQRIAKAGYERTVREHTYANRFSEIFKRMNLPVDRVQKETVGSLQEIS
jgi:spore maturation protein CgeB